jgi:hypothetical protein
MKKFQSKSAEKISIKVGLEMQDTARQFLHGGIKIPTN